MDDVLVGDLDLVTGGGKGGAEEGGHVREESGFDGGGEVSPRDDVGEPVGRVVSWGDSEEGRV